MRSGRVNAVLLAAALRSTAARALERELATLVLSPAALRLEVQQLVALRGGRDIPELLMMMMLCLLLQLGRKSIPLRRGGSWTSSGSGGARNCRGGRRRSSCYDGRHIIPCVPARHGRCRRRRGSGGSGYAGRHYRRHWQGCLRARACAWERRSVTRRDGRHTRGDGHDKRRRRRRSRCHDVPRVHRTLRLRLHLSKRGGMRVGKAVTSRRGRHGQRRGHGRGRGRVSRDWRGSA